MNKLRKELIADFYKSNIAKFLMVYIILGILIFTNLAKGTPYINMINGIMGNSYLISFFLIPTIIFSTIYIVSNVNKSKDILMRINNRKKIFYFQIAVSVYNTTIIFFLFLFTTILFSNLFASRMNFIANDPYYSEINNLVGLIISLIKLYIFLISVSIFNITFTTLKKSFSVVVIDLLIIISFLIYLPDNISWLLPAHYLGHAFIFKSIVQNIIYSFMYLILFLGISSISFKRIISRKAFI